uniref:Uncharacterized protein n=1 Tax=Anguilla anguilla TaxID=7936 RepID=A0A0E9PTA9_ANGAN
MGRNFLRMKKMATVNLFKCENLKGVL